MKGFVVIKGLLTFLKKIYIFKKLRSKFFKLYYAELESRYFGK